MTNTDSAQFTFSSSDQSFIFLDVQSQNKNDVTIEVRWFFLRLITGLQTYFYFNRI